MKVPSHPRTRASSVTRAIGHFTTHPTAIVWPTSQHTRMAGTRSSLDSSRLHRSLHGHCQCDSVVTWLSFLNCVRVCWRWTVMIVYRCVDSWCVDSQCVCRSVVRRRDLSARFWFLCDYVILWSWGTLQRNKNTGGTWPTVGDLYSCTSRIRL